MATKYEMIYRQIKDNIEEIKIIYDYSNDSIAFGHLILRYIFNISNDEAYNSMTDGGNDNGIDAVYFEKDANDNILKSHFFQFKFPSNPSKLNFSTKRDEVLKVLEGYEHFTGNDAKFNQLPWSDLLKDKKNEFNEINSFNHNLWLIKFSTFDDSDNERIFMDKINAIEASTGNSINSKILKAKEITEYHEKNRLNEWPSFDIKYKTSLGVFSDDNSSVFHAYVSVKEIYESLRPIKSTVLEGNVRYYDHRSSINKGIKESLETDFERFHLLNNGITIVCEGANDKNATDTIVITKGSVINGAQTIGTIIDFMDEIGPSKHLEYEKSFVYVKVIKLSEVNSLIEDIVFTLNTQNTMKMSYRISNNQTIKDIQTKINNETDFFLEIKKNEYYHNKDTIKDFNKTLKNVIDIEIFIQCFVAYYDIADMGHITKTSRGALFTQERIEKIVSEIDKDKLLISYDVYIEIMNIIKLYRSYRKDNSKKEILDVLSIDESKIDDYRYLNTGNFILLFAIGQFHEQKDIEFSRTNIIPIINILAEFFRGKEYLSNETKKKENFDIIKELSKDWTL